jgi:nucleotide-binding universal stress UspA family protein
MPESEANELLEDAARYCQFHGVSPEVEYISDSPKKMLLESARTWGADLIAIGASTRHRLLHRIVGDVPHTLIKSSDLHLFLAQ